MSVSSWRIAVGSRSAYIFTRHSVPRRGYDCLAAHSGQVPKISHGVRDVHEAVPAGDLLGPGLHGRALHLDGPPAGAADQMVVVALAAPAVEVLAAGGRITSISPASANPCSVR
jgi:hypothetical protein